MTELLDGKTGVVTGGASGIGRGIALTMAEHGADVVVADVRETPRTGDATPVIEAVDERTEARGAYVDCDVTDSDDVEAAVERAEEFGGIDVMVNNAGITDHVEFLESTEEDFDALLDVNLKGVYFGCRAAAERMVEGDDGGSIVNVASAAAERGSDRAGSFLYSASKGGVKSMTFALAAHLGPDVRVNAIEPGFIDETGLAADHHDEAAKREVARNSTLERLGVPQDIGHAAVFLASDFSSYITGEALLVDGGSVHTSTA